MASSKEYLEFIMEQLAGQEDVSWRAMMGEYILYHRGKIVGGIYDEPVSGEAGGGCESHDAGSRAGAAVRRRERNASGGRRRRPGVPV